MNSGSNAIYKHVKDKCLHQTSRVPPQSHDAPQVLLQILQPISHQISQLPPTHIQLCALLHELVDPPLMLVRDDLSSHLAPPWLLNFRLHGLQFGRFCSQNIPHLVQVTGEHFLLILHVLPNVSFALLEGIIEDLQDAFTQTLEFAGDGAVHLVVEGVQLVVQSGDFALYLLVEVLQDREGFDAGCLKTSEVGSAPIGEIALGLAQLLLRGRLVQDWLGVAQWSVQLGVALLFQWLEGTKPALS